MLTRTIVLAMFTTSGFFCTGCAHTQARRHANHQAATIADLQQQQVLDNLALFMTNPDATPFFAVPTGGTAQIIDSASANVNLVWSATTILTESLGITGSRNVTSNWSLQPINDPDKLQLMRCAYQVATGHQLANLKDCPDCDAITKIWHPASELADVPGIPEKQGVECIPDPGWFGVGCGKCVPKGCGCLVGRYCDTYVWVCPGRYDDLNKLTMVILDYATGKPNAKPQQEVTTIWEPVGYDQNNIATGFRVKETVTKTIQFAGRPKVGLSPKQSSEAQAIRAEELRAEEFGPEEFRPEEFKGFRPRETFDDRQRSLFNLPR